MRILAFVDTHSSKSAIQKIAEKSSSVELLVCSGDISRFETDLRENMSILNEIGKQILIVHGNHEEERTLRRLCTEFENFRFIHKKQLSIGEYEFTGYGGGGFEKEVPEMQEFFKSIRFKRNSVFVTHAPPYQTKLDQIDGRHNGNNTLRNLIIKHQPVLSLSGHFHENWGKKDKIGNTVLINPGPQGLLIEI